MIGSWRLGTFEGPRMKGPNPQDVQWIPEGQAARNEGSKGPSWNGWRTTSSGSLDQILSGKKERDLVKNRMHSCFWKMWRKDPRTWWQLEPGCHSPCPKRATANGFPTNETAAGLTARGRPSWGPKSVQWLWMLESNGSPQWPHQGQPWQAWPHFSIGSTRRKRMQYSSIPYFPAMSASQRGPAASPSGFMVKTVKFHCFPAWTLISTKSISLSRGSSHQLFKGSNWLYTWKSFTYLLKSLASSWLQLLN